MFNIFSLLLFGLGQIAGWLMNTFFLPPGSQAGLFSLINFANFFSNGVGTVIELTGAALSTFNWIIPGVCFGIDMLLFLIQLVITIWDFVLGLIKKIPLM